MVEQNIVADGHKVKGKASISCSWCSEVQPSAERMVRHWLLCHLQYDAKCLKCSQPMKNSIMGHKCTLSCPIEQKKYPCKNLKLRSKKHVAKHVLSAHDRLICELCDKSYRYKDKLKLHIDKEAARLSQSCLLCKRQFPEETCGQEMLDHLSKEHFGNAVLIDSSVETSTVEPGANPDVSVVSMISMRFKPNKTERYQFDHFQCPHCKRYFSARSGLKIHAAISHKKAQIVFCPRCPTTFKSLTACKTHIKADHKISKRAKSVDAKSAQEGTTRNKVKNAGRTSDVSINVDDGEAGHQLRNYVPTTLNMGPNDVDHGVALDVDEPASDPNVQGAPADNNSRKMKVIEGINDSKSSVESTSIKTEGEYVTSNDNLCAQMETETNEDKQESSLTAPPESKQKKAKSKRPMPALLRIGNDVKNKAAPSLVGVQVSSAPASLAASQTIVSCAPLQGYSSQPLMAPSNLQFPGNVSTSLSDGRFLVNSASVSQPDDPSGVTKILLPPTTSPSCIILSPMVPQSSSANFSGGMLTTPPSIVRAQPPQAISVGGQLIPIISSAGLPPVRTTASAPSIGPVFINQSQLPIMSTGMMGGSSRVIVPASGVVGSTATSLAPPSSSSSVDRIQIVQVQGNCSMEAVNQTNLFISGMTTTTPTSSHSTPTVINLEDETEELPRVITKRSNKKLAEDNPFFLVDLIGQELRGSCRLCRAEYMFADAEAMERHFKLAHDTIIEVCRFKLYYEISRRVSKRGRAKFFICLFCGKEFTTKFNVRRHQMLYCPRKSEIDPKDLGLTYQANNADEKMPSETEGDTFIVETLSP